MVSKVNEDSTRKYIFRNLTRTQKLSAIAPPLLAAVSLVLYLVFYWGKVDVFYIYLFGSVTASVFIDRIARNNFENDMMLKMERFQKAAADMEHIGDSLDGFDWFCKNNSGLRTVYNTVYRPVAGNVQHIQEGYGRYLSAIRKALDNGCVWHDLVCPHFEIPVIPIEGFLETLTEIQKSTYHAKELKNVDVPMFQLTIFEFRDGTASVSFGWDYPRPNAAIDRPRVFMSHERETTDFFRRYFMELWNSRKAEVVYEPPVVIPDISDSRQRRVFARLIGRPSPH